MTIETLKFPNPRSRNSISVIKSKFLSVSSMNSLLAILKVTDARRDVILVGELYKRFPWIHLAPHPLDGGKHVLGDKHLGGCHPPRPTASVDNSFFDLHNSSDDIQRNSMFLIMTYFLCNLHHRQCIRSGKYTEMSLEDQHMRQIQNTYGYHPCIP